MPIFHVEKWIEAPTFALKILRFIPNRDMVGCEKLSASFSGVRGESIRIGGFKMIWWFYGKRMHDGNLFGQVAAMLC